MARLKIEYYPARCVGNKQCIKNDPKSFGFDKGKALLKGSVRDGRKFVLVKELSDGDSEKTINAAKSCPVNAINVTDLATGKTVVSSSVSVASGFKEIKASYRDEKEFVLDPKGYFLIRVDRGKGCIEVGFCRSRNIVEVTVTGKKALDIYMTILRENLIDRPDHAAYLGRELAKAELALKYCLEYVQDNELILKK